MNLEQMLYAKVTPLSEYQPTESRREKKKNAPKNPNVANANKVRHNNSFEKYRAALGQDWLTTREIEKRMKLRPRGSGTTLTNWFRQGHLERRPAGGEEYNSRKGYEWRIKDQQGEKK